MGLFGYYWNALSQNFISASCHQILLVFLQFVLILLHSHVVVKFLKCEGTIYDGEISLNGYQTESYAGC